MQPYQVAPNPIQYHAFLLAFGLFTFVVGSFGTVVKYKLFVSEPLIGLVLGTVLSGNVLGWLDFGDVTTSLEAASLLTEIARTVLAVQVFTTAMELPKGFLRQHWSSLLVLLSAVMLASWWITAGLAMGILRLSLLPAMLIGACLAPTDPVLAHVVVKGSFAKQHIPVHLRFIVSAESGINDGSVFPFVYLVYLLLSPLASRESTATFVGHYIVVALLYKVVLPIVIGYVIGFAAGKLTNFVRGKGWMQNDSLIAQSFVLALLVLGACEVVDINGILACFVAGTAFQDNCAEQSVLKNLKLQESADLLAGNSFFLIFGTVVPWRESWWAPHWSWWQLVLFVFSVLLLRRLPVLIALFKAVPACKSFTEAAYAGWFGPMGAGAVFYAADALVRMHEGHMSDEFRPGFGESSARDTWLAVSAVVVASTFVHAVTGVPGTLLLYKGFKDKNQPRDEKRDEEIG